ncbi:MAG: lysylphosphatidylglycerol synthase transmembrane domain-containing protein [Pseudomonadota bacterium]
MDGAAVVAQLGDLSITWVCLGVIALTVATLSMARRWQVVATHLGLRLSLGSALREYYLGTFINQVLPGGVTGDVARAFRVRKEADLQTAAVSVALERLLGQFAIFALLAVGLAATVFLPGSLERGHWLWVAILGLLALSLAGLVLSRQDGALGRFATLALALQRRPELIAHAVLTCGCLVFSFYACARATGTVLPVIATATLIP